MSEDNAASWGHKAARLSWSCVLLGIFVASMTGRIPHARNPGLAIGGGLLLIGGVCGVLALVSMPWCGVRRVLLPALAGILPLGIVIAAAVPAYIAFQKQAEARQAVVPLEVPKWRLTLGGEVEVDVEGRKVVVDIPPGSAPGAQLRVGEEGEQQLVFELRVEP